MPPRKTKVVAAQEQAAPSKVIYCGPSLPNGTLNQYTVFTAGAPPHLAVLIQQCPAIQQLMMPVEDLNKVMALIASTGSAERLWYNEILKFITGGAKNGL